MLAGEENHKNVGKVGVCYTPTFKRPERQAARAKNGPVPAPWNFWRFHATGERPRTP